MDATIQAQSGCESRSDAELIERVWGGDVRTYGLLVQRYERAVLATVLPVLRDVHAAQDVVQDVFVGCFTRLASLRDPSRFGPWLLKSAEREAFHASRRVRRMRIASSEAAADEVGADPPVPMLSDEREQLLRCVRALPAHERLAVSLRYFEGCSVQEIAKATGLTVGTITKQLSRAIQRLREQLNEKDSASWKPKTKSLVP